MFHDSRFDQMIQWSKPFVFSSFFHFLYKSLFSTTTTSIEATTKATTSLRSLPVLSLKPPPLPLLHLLQVTQIIVDQPPFINDSHCVNDSLFAPLQLLDPPPQPSDTNSASDSKQVLFALKEQDAKIEEKTLFLVFYR